MKIDLPPRSREELEQAGWTMWDGLGTQIPRAPRVDVLLRNGTACSGQPEFFWWGRMAIDDGHELALSTRRQRRDDTARRHAPVDPRYAPGREIVAWRSLRLDVSRLTRSDQLNTDKRVYFTDLI